MTTRTDIIIDYLATPRVVEVNSPSTIMNMQDLMDTLRKQEDSFQGMTYPKLANASGKEDLGDGVSVGITVGEQNLRLGFEGRTTPAETGTVSTIPGSPIAGRDSFTDGSADFVTAGVERGSLVINFTDHSVAEVISRTSATQLVTKTLVNGMTNTYSVSDIYHVFNIIQCFANGGNLTAVDDVDATMNAIQPTPFTQVVTQASSSAVQVSTGSGIPTVQEIVDGVYDEIILGSEDFRNAILRLLERLDLDPAKPNTYANDGSNITGDEFTLTKTDNGDGTSTVQRS